MRRRVLRLAVLLVASLASVGTTPAVPGIDDSASGTVVLTSEDPTATLRVVLRLSATAYDPRPDDPGTLAIGLTAARDSIPGRDDEVPVQIAFANAPRGLGPGDTLADCSVELPPPRLREVCQLTRYVYPFTDCRRREPCEVDLTVELRWPDPPVGSSLELEWDVEAWLDYELKSGVPSGASMDVEVIVE
jgi:hypothetical protein